MGCKILDGIFHGGLPTRGIIEVTGEAGSGKTQFCLQALMQAHLPPSHGGLGGGSLWISTEGEFPSSRWEQITNSFLSRYDFLDPKQVHDSVITTKIETVHMLWDLLNQKVKTLLETRPIKLIVIDSIAAIFRYEFTKEDSIQKANELVKHAHQLKLISDHFNIPILVINQVSDLFYDRLGPEAFENQRIVIPALGLAWGNCVHTRIVLRKTKRNYMGEDVSVNYSCNKDGIPNSKRRKHNETTLREMSIVLSPHLPNNSCYYIIDFNGIHGVLS